MQNLTMEPTTLFHFVNTAYLKPLRKKIENDMKENKSKKEKECEKELFAHLNAEQAELAYSYIWEVKNNMEYLLYQIEMNLLEIGVKIGTELQETLCDKQ